MLEEELSRTQPSALAPAVTVEGPAQVSREWGKRRIVIQSHVRGRDLGGFAAEVQRAVADRVTLPDGYFVTYGGQFENRIEQLVADSGWQLPAGDAPEVTHADHLRKYLQHARTVLPNLDKLGRVRIACMAAIQLGDPRAVARLTCETARLRDSISLASTVRL